MRSEGASEASVEGVVSHKFTLRDILLSFLSSPTVSFLSPFRRYPNKFLVSSKKFHEHCVAVCLYHPSTLSPPACNLVPVVTLPPPSLNLLRGP